MHSGRHRRNGDGLATRLAVALLVTSAWAASDGPVLTYRDPRPENAGPGQVDRHAAELDLACATYQDGVNWPRIQTQLKVFLKDPAGDHPFFDDLMAIAGSKPKTDCYIGLLSLGYFGLLFMPPERRRQVLEGSLFGGVHFQEQIPLSYWDTIASGWPVFSLLELVAVQLAGDGAARPGPACCDHLGEDPLGLEAAFMGLLVESLQDRRLVPPSRVLAYLGRAPARCSWGKASAYFAFAEHLLRTDEAPRLHQAARDMMSLGEFQLDHCMPGRNATVVEQMSSAWPIWGFLRRIEADTTAMAALLSQHSGADALPRMPPGYRPPAPTVLPVEHLVPTAWREGRQEPRADETAAASRRDVHVAMAADRRHAEGLLAVLHSVVANTAAPERVCIHMFCLESEVSFYVSALKCSFGGRLQNLGGETEGRAFDFAGVQLEIHSFDPNELVWAAVDQNFTAGTAMEAGDLGVPHNFVRFHLARFVPPSVARKLIYLDTDIVVRGDVCELHDSALLGCPGSAEAGESRCMREPVVAAVPRGHLPISVYLKVLSPRSPSWLPSMAQSFNAGVMVIDMVAWDHANITDRVAALVQRNVGGRFWRHGSQPPLLMLLYDRVDWLASSWNVDGLGHKRELEADVLANAKILHWTGPLKPWLANGLHREWWKPFAVHCW